MRSDGGVCFFVLFCLLKRTVLFCELKNFRQKTFINVITSTMLVRFCLIRAKIKKKSKLLANLCT